MHVVEVCQPGTGKERVRNGQRTGEERTKNGYVKPERTCDVGPYHRNGSGPADSVLCPFQSVLCPFLPCSYARSGCSPGPRAQERELIFFSSRSRSVPVPNQFPFQMGPSLPPSRSTTPPLGALSRVMPWGVPSWEDLGPDGPRSSSPSPVSPGGGTGESPPPPGVDTVAQLREARGPSTGGSETKCYR